MMRLFLIALLLGLPALAPAQDLYGDLDNSIADYEDTLQKIRQGWIWIPVPDAGAFISREAEAGLLSHMIFLGMLDPDSVAAKHREYRAMTRVVEAEITSTLELLRERRRNSQPGAPPPTPPPTRPSPPDRTAALVTGTWAVNCMMGDTPLREGGSFSLQLRGDGSVGGAYSGPSGTFNVGGTVDDAGNIQGSGNHPDGTFQYFARVQIVGGAGRLLSGNVLFNPSDPGVTCTGGSLTPP
jgi:hypothetical protein